MSTALRSSAPGTRTLSADQIATLLPHRYPFFLLDRVTALVPGVSATAIKNVAASDPVLAGHFPGRMLYPGVLLVECVAQLAAVIYGSAVLERADDATTDVSHRVGYLAEIRQAKFFRPTYPGDQVVFRATSGTRLGSLISVLGEAHVGPDPVLSVRLAVTERDENQ